jgi:hypothetical protein
MDFCSALTSCVF